MRAFPTLTESWGSGGHDHGNIGAGCRMSLLQRSLESLDSPRIQGRVVLNQTSTWRAAAFKLFMEI